MIAVLPRIACVLTLAFCVLGSAPSWADDIVLNDRKMDRALDEALDALRDLSREIYHSDARRREQLNLERQIIRIEDSLSDIRNDVRGARRVEGGVVIDDRRVRRDLDRAQGDLNTFISGLKDYERELDRAYNVVATKASDVDDALKGAHKALRRATSAAPKPRSDRPSSDSAALGGPQNVDSATFTSMLSSLKGASFDDERLEQVMGFVKHNRFSASQIHDLLTHFDFDNKRVKAAIALYPSCIDPNNWFKVYAAFEFDSNKSKVRKAVGQ